MPRRLPLPVVAAVCIRILRGGAGTAVAAPPRSARSGAQLRAPRGAKRCGEERALASPAETTRVSATSRIPPRQDRRPRDPAAIMKDFTGLEPLFLGCEPLVCGFRIDFENQLSSKGPQKVILQRGGKRVICLGTGFHNHFFGLGAKL